MKLPCINRFPHPWNMRWFAYLVAALLLTALPSWGSVQAQDAGTVELTIVARDSGCPSGIPFCFKVVSGNLADAKAGASVRITFKNEGFAPHDLHVTTSSMADKSHQDTSKSYAIAASRANMAGGDQDTFTFTVPAGAQGIYLWCDVEGHEASGMWLSTGGGAAGKSSPAAPFWLVVGLLAAVVIVRRRMTN